MEFGCALTRPSIRPALTTIPFATHSCLSTHGALRSYRAETLANITHSHRIRFCGAYCQHAACCMLRSGRLPLIAWTLQV
jgi:hypothetical protein